MPKNQRVDVVARIETARKLRGLLQSEFATTVGVSLSLYGKVVAGTRRPTPSFVAACARALGTDVGELYGQPYREQLLEDRVSHLIQPIVHVLDLYDLDPDDTVELRPFDDLAADVARLGELHDAGAFGVLAETVPGLIEEVRAVAVTTGNPAAYDLLAQAYRSVYDVGVRFGYLNLSRTAMDRSGWAGERAGDAAAPLQAARHYQRSLIAMKNGDYATGLRMYAAGRAVIDAVDDTPLSMAVRGQLLLGAALLSARSGNRDDALGFLGEARAIADWTGEVGAYWMGWGPTNVGVHAVQVWADTDDPRRAVRAAAAVQIPEDWAPSRVARFWVSVADAQLWSGNPTGSLESLQTARHAAPQAVRYNPHVRDIVTVLRRNASMGHDLGAFANWVGVPA